MSYPKKLAFLLATTVLVCCAPRGRAEAAQATGNGGTVQGSVADPTGAVVPGAEITLSNAVTDYKQTTKSAADGSFRFVNVPMNQFHLRVSAPGFQTYTQELAVHTQVPLQVKAQLALAGASETVNVSASAEVLENVPAEHTDVSQHLISDLPIANTGQGLSDAITLTSGGVVADSNGFFHPQGDHAETTYVVDGQPISDQQNKVFSTQLPANAFQSMELDSSAPSAEFGDKTGLIVNAVTRSGLGQKPTASFEANYGSFGTIGEEATFGVGSSQFGNFLVLDSSRSGRFLDSPEFQPFHDIGNNETMFDRVDYQPGSRDSFHLDLFGARNWFQIPDTYDQLSQDQRQQATTRSFSLGYQHTFSPSTLLTVNPFLRQDRINYYPSSDAFNDTPATVGQDRHLTNWGTRVDLSYANSVHNLKVGTQIMQDRLIENDFLAVTDPAFNPICLTSSGAAVTDPAIRNPNACSPLGFTTNPNLSPGLIPYDLTRGGAYFTFHDRGDVNEQAIYAQDQITIKNLSVSLGLRFDNYHGLSRDNLIEPRVGLSYMFKPTGTVFRGAFTRSLETPYNENLLLSSSTGGGGLSSNLSAFGQQPIRAGHRDQYSTGLQQAIRRWVQIDAGYFWKYTKNAFDFDTLFNTSLAFPISWRLSKIDGVSGRISTSNLHGFQAYVTMGHTRARFFGPEQGGLIFNSPLDAGAFRIDHDQAFQQTTFVRYQYGKYGPWIAFTWRYDSGEVAGAVTDLADALALDGDQQAAIGFYCGTQVATVVQPITSCASSHYGATRLNIPAPGTDNPDHNPPRIAPRNLFDASVGTDNLFRKERVKTTLKFTAVNLTNKDALYNFLSTFSGTHFVTPRSYQVSLGWNY
ncbi:MAG: TonB-dependent receptor [Acidobacteriaceae bacterium]|nr:TonB-dependent receptor [Acidobacteriaceae bacterium]